MNPTTEELTKWYEDMRLIECSCYDDEGICRRCYALDRHRDRLLGRLDVLEEMTTTDSDKEFTVTFGDWLEDEIEKIKAVLS